MWPKRTSKATACGHGAAPRCTPTIVARSSGSGRSRQTSASTALGADFACISPARQLKEREVRFAVPKGDHQQYRGPSRLDIHRGHSRLDILAPGGLQRLDDGLPRSFVAHAALAVAVLLSGAAPAQRAAAREVAIRVALHQLPVLPSRLRSSEPMRNRLETLRTPPRSPYNRL